MKILLIYPPGKTSFVSPPLGLMYLAASLKQRGHEPLILDYLLERFDKERLFKIIQHGCDLIGVSAVTPLISEAISLVKIIKEQFPRQIIVLGGPHPSLLPKETLEKCQGIDFIVKGEGEEKLNSLIDYLERKKNKEDLDGIAFRDGENIIDSPSQKFIEDLDKLPFPARELISLDDYSKVLSAREKPATTLITSRGCPFQCVYCSKPVFGYQFRARSPENIFAEIELLKKQYGIRELIFYDDSFTLDRTRILKLCKLLQNSKLNIRWKCETRVNLVDEELLKSMKAAGCYLIGFGIESGNQGILNILKKGVTIAQIEKAVKMTKSVGIEVLAYFMIGIPGESEKEIEETIDFSKKLDLDFAQFSIATAYPGTELYRMAISSGKISPGVWQDTPFAQAYALAGNENLISLCDVAPEVLRHYLKKAYRSFYFRPKYILGKIKRIRSKNDIGYYFKGFKSLMKIG